MNKIVVTKEIREMLRQSNLIEGVTDAKSLTAAVKAWKYIIQQETLTMQNILETHRILMTGRLDPKYVGVLRPIRVMVGGRECPLPTSVVNMLPSWINKANLTAFESSKTNVEEFIKFDHVQYERIHPFVDGNGRTGRIFLNWQRVKAGLPILTIWDAEKQAYYRWFYLLGGGEL